MKNNNEIILAYVFGKMKKMGASLDMIDSNKWEFHLDSMHWALRVLREGLYIVPHKLQMDIVEWDPKLIDFLYKPSAECIEIYYKKTGELPAQYLNDAPLQVLKQVLFSQPNLIQYIETPPEELQKIVVERDVFAIQYIKTPTENIQKYAINKRPYSISFIENPTEEIQMLAIEKDFRMIDLLSARKQNSITPKVREFAKEQFVKQEINNFVQ